MCLLWWRSTTPPLPTWCFHTDLPAPPPPPSLPTSPPIILKLQLTIRTIAIIKSVKFPSTIKLENRKFAYITVSPKITILDKSLGTLAHFCSICHGNLSVRPLPPIQCCLSWWSCHCSFPTLSGGTGVPYSNDAISYCFQKVVNAWSSYLIQACQRLLSRIVFAWLEETMICSVGKSEKGLPVLFDFVMALTSAA